MKKKKKEMISASEIENSSKVIIDYQKEIDNDSQYSLDVDPLNVYNMPEQQKAFIRAYIEFKNLSFAADMCGIDIDTAKAYFSSYSTQQEIRRINRALYHRQFTTKVLSLEEIGGYLTSIITEENIPIIDRLPTKEKLKAVSMLLELTKLKAEVINNPEKIIEVDVESKLKTLSIDTIRGLLSQCQNPKSSDDKNELIKGVYGNNLSPEEIDYLKTLSTDELLQLIEETKKGNDTNE